MPPNKALDFLVMRRSGNFAGGLDLLERPNATTTVLLKSAGLLGLSEVFDRDLWELDGVSFGAYVNPDFSQFGAKLMNGGSNLVWIVGHDIFRVNELASTWPTNSPRPYSTVVAAASVLAALLYPDRVPWFLTIWPPSLISTFR